MLQEFRLALRSLLRSPAFTIAAVLCLALAIGANTAIFSVIDAVLVRPLPYAEPDRLVMLWERSARRPDGHNVVSPANFLDWRAQSRSVAEAAAFFEWRTNLTNLGDPAEIPTQFTTAAYFRVLGVDPILGRTYSAEEDAPNRPEVVVLSHGFWQRRMGGDSGVVGRTLTLDGEPATIVGVMPDGFALPGSRAELWMPLGLDPAEDFRITSGRYLNVVGRLAPGTTVVQADAELRTLARRLEAAHPAFNTGWSAVAVPLREQVVGGTRRPLLVLAGVVAFVLLIACANVANLALARAAAREREIAVRAALGANRWQVMRGQLVESLLVSAAGGILGLLLAVWGTDALVAAAPANLPRAAEIGVDSRTLVFTAFLSILTGLLFGLAPALQAARADLQSTLREGGRGAVRGRARGALVAVQVALSLILLVGAGLMIRSFARLNSVDPGFEAAGVLTARVALPDARYPDSTAPQIAFFQNLLPRIRAIPGVRSASATNSLPFTGPGVGHSFAIEGRPLPEPGNEPSQDMKVVDHEYFRTLGIPVVRGTAFTERHTAGAPWVVAISEAAARAYFTGEDPIGRRVSMEWDLASTPEQDTLGAEIIAVVGDVRGAGLDSMPRPTLYWSLAQLPWSVATLVVRGDGDVGRLAAPVMRELHALDSELPLAEVRPFESYIGASVATSRFTMLLLGAFSVVAVILAGIGIAGVIAHSVAQRTREIGVRLALGAQQRDVLGLVLRQGMTLTLAGIAAGVVGALALSRVLRSLLYGTSPTDVLTFAAVALLLAAVALLATWLPARRATRVDPVVALRSE